MTLELTQRLGSQDQDDLFHWDRQVFPVEGLALHWCEPSHHLVCREAGRAIGHIGFGRYPLFSDGEPLEVIGLGQVVVRPEYQGQGIPAQLFEALHERAPGVLGPELFALFCPPRLEGYYRRHGYQTHAGRVTSRESEALGHTDFCFMYHGKPRPGKRLVLTTHPW